MSNSENLTPEELKQQTLVKLAKRIHDWVDYYGPERPIEYLESLNILFVDALNFHDLSQEEIKEHLWFLIQAKQFLTELYPIYSEYESLSKSK